MAFSLDSYMGIYDDALLLRSKRTEVLAANIANADTPNYKARDVDFKSLMEQAKGQQQSMQMSTTNKGHFPMSHEAGELSDEMLLYRQPMNPSVDNNTVDTELEKAEFAKNSIQYMADLRFVSGKFSSLKTALKGQAG